MLIPRVGMEGPEPACAGKLALAAAGGAVVDGADAAGAIAAECAIAVVFVVAAVVGDSTVVAAMAWVAVAAAGGDCVDAAGLSAMTAAA
ncbi:MAG: hypothetical protein WBR29_11795 [Gammaproteobacteria bacterium]